MKNQGTENRGSTGPGDGTTRNEIDQIVASLHDAVDANDARATVDAWSRAGKTRELLELAAAIERACEVEGHAALPLEVLSEHVEEVLAATPATALARDHIDALLGSVGSRRVRSVSSPRPASLRVRTLASRLGHGQARDVFLAAIARHADGGERDELLACWMHEVVLRGMALEGEESAQSFRAQLAARRHVLGRLPLSLLDVELEAPARMPLYGPGTILTTPVAIDNVRDSLGATSSLIQQVPRVERIEDRGLEQRIAEAVVHWTTASNGKFEAQAFRLEPSLGAVEPGEWLVRALPLVSSKGATELHIELAGATAIWGALFSAAANGGAYPTGLGGAYGRHAAWNSLGALVDASPSAEPAEIERRACTCAFLKFRARNEWFHDVAWDLGILAVREGGASVAVLAATDTD